MVDGEWHFIDGEWRAVQEDHGVIIGHQSMECMSEALRVKRGRMPNGDSIVKVGDLDDIETVFITFPR